MFVIACSNVANLILARSVRREGELAVRAALGAGSGALRRTLLAESLVLCGAGAVLGVVLARPFVALVAAMPLAFRSARSTSPSIRACSGSAPVSRWPRPCCSPIVPRLPSPHAPAGLGLASGGVRITPGTNRRLRVFATTQIAFSFVLLAGAGMLVATLDRACRRRRPATDMRQVLAFDMPTTATGVGLGDTQAIDFYQEATQAHRRSCLGVEGVVARELRALARCRQLRVPAIQFAVEGYKPADGEENPRGAVPHRRAPLLRGARRSDARRPRLHVTRTGAAASRSIDRQPERGAAALSERRRGEPAHDGGPIRQHLRQTRAPSHRRRGGGRRRRERRARARR